MERSISILLVDDDKALLEILASLLESEGHEVEAVESAYAALERLRGRAYDLILTDLKMRRMNGLELLQAARLKNPHARVAIITAYATVETAVAAMRDGAFDYLPKPFQLAELRALIRRAAEARDAPEAVGGVSSR